MRHLAAAATLALALTACAEKDIPSTYQVANGSQTGGREFSGVVNLATAIDSLMASSGDAVSGATITVRAAVAAADSGYDYVEAGKTTTDATGHFALTGLPTTHLLVDVAPPAGSNLQHTYLDLPAGTSPIADLHVLMHTILTGTGGGGNPPGPDSSVVSGGPSRTIDGTLFGVATFVGADSGKVSGPVAGATVTASTLKNGVLTVIGTTTTDAAGKFSLPSMPGEQVILTMTPPSGTSYRTGTYSANPTGQTRTTVTAYLYPGAAD